jgi:uncharacterized protein (DUF362 family)
MANVKPEEISRRSFLGAAIGTALVAGIGCASETDANSSAGGGAGATGTGGSPGEGGSATGQGGTSTGSGGMSSGGATATGGSAAPTATGGVPATGGATDLGGTMSTGGVSSPGGSLNSGGNTSVTGGVSAQGGASVTGGTSAQGGASVTGGRSARGGASATGGTSAGGGVSGAGGTTSQDAPLVAMVRGTDWVQATMDAIALAGGLPDLSGKTVLLKPNIISADANATTSVDVIHGVVKAAKAKNAARIVVADCGWLNSDVVANMQSLGITAMCTSEGAETLDLRADTHTTRSHPNASAFPDGIDFSDAVFNAGYVINLPVCKSHAMGKYSMALKAWYGCTENGRPHGSTWVAPAELHLFRQEEFVVLDATKAMITGGPSSGTMVESKIVLASRDAVAADVTGLCIHKYSGATLLSAKGDAWNIHQIKRALALKFPGWLSSPQEIPYAQEGVTEHADIMAWCMA